MSAGRGATGSAGGRRREGAVRRAHSGSPYEARFGYCRAVRVGDRVWVSGTAPIGPGGETVAEGNPGAQARRCLEVIGAALEELVDGPEERAVVVRTRAYLADPAHWEAVAAAHREAFSDEVPASTALVAELMDPAWAVELEAEAVVLKQRGGVLVRSVPTTAVLEVAPAGGGDGRRLGGGQGDATATALATLRETLAAPEAVEAVDRLVRALERASRDRRDAERARAREQDRERDEARRRRDAEARRRDRAQDRARQERQHTDRRAEPSTSSEPGRRG